MDDNEILQAVYAKAAASRQQTTRRRMAATGGAFVAVVALLAAALTTANHPGKTVVADNDSGAHRSLTYDGIIFDIPDGWTTAKPGCGLPADHTVTIGTWAGSCPGTLRQPAITAVRLTPLFGRQMFLQPSGGPITWNGHEPGRLDEATQGDLHVATVSLPRRNAVVTAYAPDASTARHLALDDLHPAAGSAAVLGTADQVFIQSFAGTDGDGLQRNATITDPQDVATIVADLRAMPSLDGSTPLCDPLVSPQSATITLSKADDTETFAARFDSCLQVMNGNGEVSQATDAVRADVIRLVPNSGIDPAAPTDVPSAPPCDHPGLPGSGIEPVFIFFGCATSADNLDHLYWDTWTATSASGTATHNINNCLRGGPNPPSCAEGTYVSYPVKMTLTNPGTVDGERVFRTLTLSAGTSNEPSEATLLWCGGGRQNHCTVPRDSWGYVPNQG